MRLTSSTRRNLSKAIHASPVLTGNQKVHKPGAAISALAAACTAAGFTLDMVSGDLLLGDKGTRHLPFRAALPEGADPFTEGEAVETCIVFVWENLGRGRDGQPEFEIIAYAA